MVTRREVHGLILGSLALGAIGPGPLQAAAADSTADPADLFLNRLTFGATPASRAEFASMGAGAWLDRELARAPAEDAALARRLAEARLRLSYEAGDDGEGHSWPGVDELRPLGWLDAPSEAAVPLLDYETPMDYAHRMRPADEVIAASLLRAVHAEGQLREVMTQFWHDHFNVMATRDEGTAVFFPAYDRMLRANAFGNFRALLGEVARAPAMLNYLGNSESRASPANENFARELLELYTLGAGNYLNDRYPNWHDVPGAEAGLAEGYIDQDVYEVARAFTGWTIGDGRWVSEGVTTPKTGLFHYVEAWHDPYQKRILGREFAPNRAPMADGEEVLDILAAHPATARFVVTKIVRRLLADEPDLALVERLAGVFEAAREAPDQIAQVIRALVLAPEFAATPPGKLRRPFEYVAACLRASGAEVVSPEAAFRWELMKAGWRQHEFGPPTGHPDRAKAWANTTVLARMADYALYMHEPWAGITTTDLGATLPEGALTYGAAADAMASRLGLDGSGTRETFLATYGAAEEDPLPEDPEERRYAAALAFAVAAASRQTFLR
jgi:uncharacterized protein (DUF1800 family)